MNELLKRGFFPEELVSSVAKKGNVKQYLKQVRSFVLTANTGRFLCAVHRWPCVEVGKPQQVLEVQS